MTDLPIELARHYRYEADRVGPLADQAVLSGVRERAPQRGSAIRGSGRGLRRITGGFTSRAPAMSESLIPLEQLATEANVWLDRAKVAEDLARDLRISAGEILAEAKDRVRAGEPGHTNWARWVRENINHFYRDANKCIAIAHRAMAVATCIAIAGSPVTIDTVKRDIQLLSDKDRAALAEWLIPDNEDQRDRYGIVIDPLAVRLRRVLHRMTEEINRKSSKREQHIYNELSLLARSQFSVYNQSRIINLQFLVSQLVCDLTDGSLSQSMFSKSGDIYQNGLRELKAIVTELSVPVISLEAAE